MARLLYSFTVAAADAGMLRNDATRTPPLPLQLGDQAKSRFAFSPLNTSA